jgi:hypothetical protein
MNHNPDGLEEWIAALGITNAPVPRAGLKVALDYFHFHMPSLPRTLRLAFLKAMDLSQPVKAHTLSPPLEFAAFRKCNEDPFKLFYTKIGTGMQHAGLNPANRSFLRYTLISAVPVLESRCAPALDTWTNDRSFFLAAGGAVQYIIPDSFRYLKLVV